MSYQRVDLKKKRGLEFCIRLDLVADACWTKGMDRIPAQYVGYSSWSSSIQAESSPFLCVVLDRWGLQFVSCEQTIR